MRSIFEVGTPGRTRCLRRRCRSRADGEVVLKVSPSQCRRRTVTDSRAGSVSHASIASRVAFHPKMSRASLDWFNLAETELGTRANIPVPVTSVDVAVRSIGAGHSRCCGPARCTHRPLRGVRAMPSPSSTP